MRIIKTFFLLALLALFVKPATAAEFRHRGVTLPKKTAKYGLMGLGYLPQFEVESLYGLNIPQSEPFVTQVINHLQKNNQSALNSPIDLDGQKSGLNIGFGFKSNSMFRFEGMLTVAQGRRILINTPFTADTTVNNGNANYTTSTTFSNVDVMTRYASLMLNTYLDSDFSIFRSYIGAGLGLNILTGSIRGNTNFGTGIQTDQVSTAFKYSNFGIGGNVTVGTQILVSKAVAIDIAFRQFFSVASFSSVSGSGGVNKTVTTQSPAKHTMQMISLGMVFYF